MLYKLGSHSLIGRRFILYTVLFSSCIALLFTLIQVQLEYKRELSKHAMYQQLINDSLLNSLSKSIWTYDDSQIYLQLQGIVKIPTIEQVKLNLPENIKFNVGNIQSNQLNYTEIDVQYSSAQDSRVLAQLVIVSGMDETYLHLMSFGSIMLLLNATKTALVVIFMLFLVDRLIGQHLYTISRHILNYQETKKPLPLKLHRTMYIKHDEIDQLVDSLNSMQQRIYFERNNSLAEAQKREHLQAKIIEQKEQLYALERNVNLSDMTSLGQELEQPLMGIVGYANIARRMLDEDSKDVERFSQIVDKISNNSHLATSIVERSKNVLNLTIPVLELIDVNSLISTVINMLGHELNESGVIVAHHNEQQRQLIKVDGKQFEQVLIHLIRNAIDALQEQPDDLRFIEISCIEDGRFTRVIVEDNGQGISEEISNKLFKPFFTTKKQGLGIGLSSSKNLIEAMHGTIVARNRLDRGACFTISIPLLERASD
ncbi:MAG: GHKL domain-containing protein [Gammaproteobacteria bacterium]|nr:GHKL domain-containing protein [Gammaproteobacteria bacterium]